MSSTLKFEKLFQPIRLGKLEIKNRFVLAPMFRCSATGDGCVTEQTKACYEERARGGVGLVIIEETCVDAPTGQSIPGLVFIDDDKHIPGLKELAAVIRKHGARVAMQLHHAGRLAATHFTGCQGVAPSAIAALGRAIPRELSVTEIEAIVDKFAAGAERAQKAGYDAIEIQACAGYIFTQFLSSESNTRQDTYGGSLENRARLLLDTVAAIQKRVGKDYPLWVRLTAQQLHTENGITLAESQQLARWLEGTGIVALNVSADFHQSAMRMPWKVAGEKLPRPPMAHPPGFMVPLVAEIKKVVSIPVMAVGWLTPETGEQALNEGKIDMVVMGRRLLADPDIPQKVAAGKTNEIRPCIGCLMCQVDIDKAIKCTVNPSVSRELDYPIMPARNKKRVVVVGGGVAGLEAARVAARKGHTVVLYEKEPTLGGQLHIAARPPHKSVLNDVVEYYSIQMARLGVKVELSTEATPEVVLNASPDTVIIATGVTRSVPKIPGIEMSSVVDAADVLSDKVKVGSTAVVIGGGVVGLETTELLAEEGKKITVVEMLEELAAGMEKWHKLYLLERLNLLRVTILTKTKAEAIQETGLLVSSHDDAKQLLPADTIIASTGAVCNQALYQQLSGKVTVYRVGDCAGPRRMLEATTEGFLASQAI